MSGLRARTRGDQQRGPVVVLLHAGIADPPPLEHPEQVAAALAALL